MAKILKQISEDMLHSECYRWFHNNHKDLRGLLCYNLNNSRNAIDGAVNVGMGLQKGRADFTFYYKGRAYFIELKNGQNGEQSTAQKNWQRIVENHGFLYVVIRDFETFCEFINKIITDFN